MYFFVYIQCTHWDDENKGCQLFFKSIILTHEWATKGSVENIQCEVFFMTLRKCAKLSIWQESIFLLYHVIFWVEYLTSNFTTNSGTQKNFKVSLNAKMIFSARIAQWFNDFEEKSALINTVLTPWIRYMLFLFIQLQYWPTMLC